MLPPRRILRKNALIAYVSIVFLVIFSHFVLKINWEQIIKIILSYYDEISICFYILSFLLIPFRLFFVKQKRIAPEIRKFRLLGPFIDLTLEPLFNASLFYAAMFLLCAIFRERAHGLSLEPFLILLVVAAILLYQSITDICEMGREIFLAKDWEVKLTAGIQSSYQLSTEVKTNDEQENDSEEE